MLNDAANCAKNWTRKVKDLSNNLGFYTYMGKTTYSSLRIFLYNV